MFPKMFLQLCCHVGIIAELSLFSDALLKCVCMQLYCMAFELLDHEWLQMRASYMDFPTVIARVKKQCDAALAHRPDTLEDLRRLLLP